MIRRYNYIIDDRRKQRNDTITLGHHLHRVYQPRFAGLIARGRLAGHARGSGRAAVLCGHHLDDHRPRNGHLEPAKRPADTIARHGQGDGDQRRHDGCCPVRLRGLQRVLDALPLGHPIWPRCWRRRCRIEQLRGASLQELAHELAALHVGRWRGDGTVYHGHGAGDGEGLARRLPHHRGDAGRIDHHPIREPAALEGTKGRGAVGSCREAQAALPA